MTSIEQCDIPFAFNNPTRSEALSNLIHFFECLTQNSVANMPRFYAPNAYFKDPFNEVNHIDDIQQIFYNMFDHVNNPRFVVHTAFESEQQAFIGWHFLFEMKRFKVGQLQCIKGASHLQLNENQLVIFHRDYWDAAEELYEKIPLLAQLMRWLKKRVV